MTLLFLWGFFLLCYYCGVFFTLLLKVGPDEKVTLKESKEGLSLLNLEEDFMGLVLTNVEYLGGVESKKGSLSV